MRKQRYSSRGCGIRRQVNRVGEDTERNNYFEQFLSDLYYYLAPGGMALPGQNLSSPKQLHDIKSAAIASSRSSASPDITITHGFRTRREKTHIFIVNTSRNRSYYSEPECTENNTIVIDINRWPEDHIAEFEKYGVRKFNEEMEILEKRIEKEARRLEKILIDAYRSRIGNLIEAGRLTEWRSWFNGNPSDQSVKEVFRQNKASIIEQENQAIKEEAERKAAEEEKRRNEKRRRLDWLSNNERLALSLEKLIPDINEYEFSDLLQFCLIFREHWTDSLNDPKSELGENIRKYIEVEDYETTQEEFLAGVMDHNLASVKTVPIRNIPSTKRIRSHLNKSDPELTTFHQINELLEKEEERINAQIAKEELESLSSKFEKIFKIPSTLVLGPQKTVKDQIETLSTYIRQEPLLRKLWSSYKNVFGTPPPKDIKISETRLYEEIAAARISKKADQILQNLPGLVDQLRKELNIVMEKIPDERARPVRIVFNEWTAIIHFSTKLLEVRSQSIESGFDKSPISTFIVSEEDSMNQVLEPLPELFSLLQIVRIEGVRNEIRTLPWRKIDTADNLRTSRHPSPIRDFAELYDAIEEGIDNLSHVSDYLDRAIPRWENEAKNEAKAYKRSQKHQKELRDARKKRKDQELAKKLENAKKYQEKLDEKNRKKEEAKQKKLEAKAKQLIQEAKKRAKEKAEEEEARKQAARSANLIRKGKRRIGSSRKTKNE